MDALETLLAESDAFSEALMDALASADGIAGGPRSEAAAAAAELSFEHGHALRALLALGTPNSAAALMRSQYEALLRAGWLLYAASDQQLERLAAPLSVDSAAAAKNARGSEDMLKDLEKLLTTMPTLRGLVLPLREIREVSWAALNSFVHGGLHPLARSRGGFPAKLAADLVKNSNGMLHMAARLLARLTPSAEVAAHVDKLYLTFPSCLPPITVPTT